MSPTFAMNWMKDSDIFMEALDSHPNSDRSYMSSLTHSLCLVLQDFYPHLSSVGVSSMTGEGLSQYLEMMKEKVKEWTLEYLPDLRRTMELKRVKEAEKKEIKLSKLMADMKMTSSTKDPWSDSSKSTQRKSEESSQEETSQGEEEEVSDSEEMDERIGDSRLPNTEGFEAFLKSQGLN